MRLLRSATVVAAGLATAAHAISLDLTSTDSIKAAASTVAANMVAYYPGDQPGGTPGLLGGAYYWWEAGGMFGSLIDYWYYTGDTTYNNITSEALIFQVSPTYDYMPANQTKDEGNDDQVFWGFAVMTAAEYKFPNPPDDVPSWISIAEAVFNSQALRWDNATCDGGLRWQIFTFNNGYDYKNAPSNGGFFNMAARLYAYTGNETYADWATSSWDWMYGVGMVSTAYEVYDGTTPSENCTSLNHLQWSYSAGMMLNGAAVMWNATNNTVWQDRATSLWTAAEAVFFIDGKIMSEITCEATDNCDVDQLSFKAYFARFLVASTKWAPFLSDSIMPYIQASAAAAAAQCTGGTSGIVCGTKWYDNGTYDGTYGVGQQMSALEVIQGNLITDTYSPVTNDTGGISHGNASLGTGATADPLTYGPIGTGGKAGAAILTIVVVVGTLGGGWWLLSVD